MEIPLSSVKVKAPAKLNIRLKVTGRRPDGYHDLDGIMVPVALYDYLEMKPVDEGIHLTCSGLSLPQDDTNLVVRAAGAFFSASGIKGGVSVKLSKYIPVAAGLGGGSSDAACTLTTLNRIYGDPLSVSELKTLALELGADVPFFLDPKPSRAQGVGEVLTVIKDWPRLCYLIVKPPVQLSTARVYSSLDTKFRAAGRGSREGFGLTEGEKKDKFDLLNEEFFNFKDILDNDLEAAAVPLYPVIREIKRLLMKAGAEGALMTGSGPSVFGVFRSLKGATRARKALRSCREWAVFAVEGIA